MTQEQASAQSNGRGKVVGAIAGIVALGVLGIASAGAGAGSPPAPTPGVVASAPADSADSATAPAFARKVDFSKICERSSGATVPTGSAAEADAYYAQIAQEVGLTSIGSLDAVLSALGYQVTAKRLQDASPSELMDPAALPLPASAAPNSILAARFFAPKITDVSQTNTPAATVGWRKIVRIIPSADSAAHKNGIDAAVVLFNFFAPIKALNPFDHADSVNTQVMLVTSKPGLSPIYWLDYGKTSEGAPLSKELDAFFDAGHTPDSAGKRAYFVPCGCIACHGGLRLDLSVKPPAPRLDADKALLNYLDTDHWFDRVKQGEDFAALAAPVIFDKGGFDVIRAINREMRDQNERVQRGSAQHRAAAHWLDLHASSADYVDNLALRALPSTSNSTVQWSDKDASDVAALKILNHYCFRCHGSVEFDVFDKSTVLLLSTPLLARLQPRGTLADARATMPPDRDIKDSDRATLRAYLQTH